MLTVSKGAVLSTLGCTSRSDTRQNRTVISRPDVGWKSGNSLRKRAVHSTAKYDHPLLLLKYYTQKMRINVLHFQGKYK